MSRVDLPVKPLSYDPESERRGRIIVANASHELKTPVASILALSGALRIAARDDPRATVKLAARLEQEAKRLGTLVRDLLELSRLDEGELPRTKVRLVNLVERETRPLRRRAESKGLQLKLDAGADDPEVAGSARDLALLLGNLVENAISYTPSGGAITVSLGVTNASAVLTVEDTGIGISEQDLTRVFERFYRVDAARSRHKGGTGLGLSIVRAVADGLNGSVAVESQLGVGSRFTVRLPLSSRGRPPDG